MNVKILLLFLVAVYLLGCGNDPVESAYPDYTKEYFPLKIGSSITYQVDSIVFDDAPGGNKLDTNSFQLKEEIAGAERTQQGDSVFIIHRFKRTDETQPWVLSDVWTASTTGTEALRTEENLIFQK